MDIPSEGDFSEEETQLIKLPLKTITKPKKEEKKKKESFMGVSSLELYTNPEFQNYPNPRSMFDLKEIYHGGVEWLTRINQPGYIHAGGKYNLITIVEGAIIVVKDATVHAVTGVGKGEVELYGKAVGYASRPLDDIGLLWMDTINITALDNKFNNLVEYYKSGKHNDDEQTPPRELLYP